MEAKLKIAKKMGVWELAHLAEGCELIGNKCTFVEKRDATGNWGNGFTWSPYLIRGYRHVTCDM